MEQKDILTDIIVPHSEFSHCSWVYNSWNRVTSLRSFQQHSSRVQWFFIIMSRSASLAYLLLSTPFLAQSAVVPQRRAADNGFQSQVQTLEAFADPTPDEVTQNFAGIVKRTGSATKSSKHLRNLRNANNPALRKRQADQPLIGALQGQEYLAQIKFQDTDVDVIVDTGSSDTWLIESSFQCLNQNSQSVSQATCNFGPTYPGTFSAEEAIPDVNFSISYGDGEFVTGVFGKADITVAGITVPAQTVSQLDGFLDTVN
jgi:aspergillopepsin I